MSFSTFALSKVYQETNYSSWNCPTEVVEFDVDAGCTGTNIATADNSTFTIRTNTVHSNYLFTSFTLIPNHKSETIGNSFYLTFNYTVQRLHGSANHYEKELLVNCPAHASQCDEIPLYSGQPGRYNVTISTYSDDADIRSASTQSLGDIILMERHSNPTYTYFQIAFRSVSIVTTVAVFGYYLFKFTSIPLRCTVEQKAIIFYVVVDILFDNPFFFLAVFSSSSFFLVLDAFLRSLFTSFSMVFILFILGGFITRKTTCLGFTLPRTIFALIYFIFDFASNVDTSISPELDTLMSSSFINSTLNIVTLILTIIWALWFIYTIIRCYVVARQHPRAIKGRYRFFVCFVIIATLLYIATLFLQTFFGATLAARLSLCSQVIAGSFGIVLMLWLVPTTLPRVTSTTLQTALHPKQQNREMAPMGDEPQSVTALSKSEDDGDMEQQDPVSVSEPAEEYSYTPSAGSINGGMTDFTAEDAI